MARTRDRVIALTIAVLFFGVSFALSFLVIWEIVKGNKEAKHVDSNSSSTDSSDVTSIQQQDAKVNGAENQAKLAGTQLADFSPIASVASLTKTDTIVGDGQEVKAGDTVTVDYTGAVAATGVVFQSSLDAGQTATFPLSNVIKGWQDGIPGMKVGGTRRLLIPAAQAYAANPPAGSNIPPNADLVFDVTLHKIGQ